MKRIVNLPMALRRSKLRHSARPPDIACSARHCGEIYPVCAAAIGPHARL
jgi:hypothetical protein